MKTVRFLSMACAALFFSAVVSAQTKATVNWPEYQFTTVTANPITSIKDQASSGTCWAFSTIAFLESEAIRINKIKDEADYPDFSEFFVVSHSYSDRAEKYIRLDGKLGFSAGSGAGDVLAVVKDYGIVPNSEMTGMNYGTALPKQAEMDAVLLGYVSAVAKVPNRTLSTAWKRGFDAVLEQYLGAYPESFKVGGKKYTAESYRDALKINPDDYISLTSYTHHPFYKPFVLEVCDNWRWDESYNVPIDEMMEVVDYALNNGYTIAWGTDVSETGFTRDGYAILVDDSSAAHAAGSDQSHWVGESSDPSQAVAPKEKEVSQETRQICYDNKTVTDDHGMQIYGIAKDQWGNKYYLVKNSWGITGKYDGIWYASEAFVKNQTLDIMIHKDALPKALAKKLGIK